MVRLKNLLIEVNHNYYNNNIFVFFFKKHLLENIQSINNNDYNKHIINAEKKNKRYERLRRVAIPSM